ncbi:MAG: FKBP-type peptidyl-prolyl cis-trans isomerase [Gammaproteobacteria bacterium]|nr:FKBP-type peptidyl-prolyl cis-trans isomerase [Gammaproteobacteria bacterium]
MISKTRVLWAGVGMALLVSGSVWAAKPATPAGKFSYAIGVQIAQGLKRDNLKVEIDPMVDAIRDVMAGRDPQLSREEIQAAFTSYQEDQKKDYLKQAQANQERGKAYLDVNRGKDGVTELESGVQYHKVKEGKGKQPTTSDTVVVHYRGTLVDGKEFDSSYSRGEPATFPVNAVIQGWQEVLPLMHVGDKWQVAIPSALAYGETGAGTSIGPNETLLFEVELLEIK